MPLELFRGSQAPRRAVCGTCGCFRMMHGGVGAPSWWAYPHRVAFEEVSGHRVLLKSGPGNRGRSACGTTLVARLEVPRKTGLILRCAGKAGNPFQTTQGNRLSCRDREGRRGSDEAVPGPSVFPSRGPGLLGNFWGSHEGCHIPFRTSGRNRGLPLRRLRGQGPHLAKTWEPRGFSRVAAGFSSYGGDFHASSFVGPGKPNRPFDWRGKAGGCARVTVGPKRPLLGVCPGPNSPLTGRQGSRGCTPESPRESGLVSRGSQGLRSLLESQRGSLGAP